MSLKRICALRFNYFAVEGTLPPGAKGIAPGVGQQEPDTDWQPI